MNAQELLVAMLRNAPNIGVVAQNTDGKICQIESVDSLSDGRIIFRLADPAPPEAEWIRPDNYDNFFYEVRVDLVTTAFATITPNDIRQIAGAIGYAFRKHIRGENLSEPSVVNNANGVLSLEFSYDSTKTQSDDPDFLAAFDDAENFIVNGSEVRKTNRTGPKGTQLVPPSRLKFVNIDFWVR